MREEDIPRMKTVEEAVRLLKELALKADLPINDFDTSIIKLRAKLETPASAQNFASQKPQRQPAWSQMSMEQCLEALNALVRKSYNQ
jgi:hypothetical protein